MRSVLEHLGSMLFLNRKQREPFEPDAGEEPIVYNDLHRELATILSETRKRAGLTLQDVSRDLHIQKRYLEAVERADFKALPGEVYAFGYVRSYARYLGLDAEQALEMFKAQAHALARRPRMQFPEPSPEGRLPGAAIILVASALVVMIYAGWYYTSISDPAVIEPVAQVDEAEPDAGDVPEVDPGTAIAAVPVGEEDADPDPQYSLAGPAITGEGDVSLAAAAPLPDHEIALAEPTPLLPVLRSAIRGAREPVSGQANGGTPAPARVEIVASADSWVHVKEFDTTLVMSRVLRSGETYRVPDRAGLTLSTTNAGGITVIVDGRQLPSLGASGDVVRDIDLNPETLASRLD